MKIAIIGAGAMGSLYGGKLCNAGNEVFLVDIWKDHVDKINNEGLTMLENDKEIISHPIAVTEAKGIGIVDLAIIFVKSIHTGDAVKNSSAILGENTLVLSLQNGYGNIEKIADYVKEENIIAGTTAHGATMIGPGYINHAGSGVTHIGLVTGKLNSRVEEVADIMKKAGFNTDVSVKVMELIWAKLIINVGVNALTAILKIKNGQLLDYKESLEMMRDAVTEAVEVAKASGIVFDLEEVFEGVVDVARKTGQNKSSMFQDVLKSRKTEIEMINGAIVNEGNKYGVATPINGMLVNLIKVIEKTY
ncbi:MAG: 2-dehydropantoate 2-reductase [Clostridiales bacterium]|nr:2-dehydropantoate 2-reductase [Clostridiales bacterium]